MLHLLVASHPVLASPSPEGWPSRKSVTRPKLVHAFALRLTPLLSGASATRLLQSTAQSATWRTSTYHAQLLSVEKTSQALPGTPEPQRHGVEVFAVGPRDTSKPYLPFLL
jgi:hypothetical protein